ncbi:MAG: iron-containing alcohol dehydrogenase [Desulfotignum sp.]
MQYHMPARLYFGPGEIQQISTVIQAKNPVLVTDKGVLNAGLLDPVLDQLGSRMPVFDGIEANPKSDTINSIAKELRQIAPDLVIGLGGGSPLDAGKALALLATNPKNIQDYEGKEKYAVDPLPFVAIPTTCGTGSEVTWVSVITDVDRKFKMSIKGPKLYPAVSIVDPDLIATLPKPMIASTGMDALTHAVEAYLSKPATLITDTHAVKAVGLILGSIEKASVDIKGHARQREELMYGSMVAGLAFGNADVTAVHCISESIGALYDIPHGVANAMFLPHVLEYNLPACTPKMAVLARTIGISAASDEQAARTFIRKIKDLSRVLEIPLFRSLDIDPDQFALIADMSYKNNSNASNPRDLGPADYQNILKAAYGD